MNRPIVGMCGFAQCGKDTMAQVLIKCGWVRGAFADELKRDVERLIGRPIASMSAQEKEDLRPVMVAYGRYRRSMASDYWITMLAGNLRSKVRPGVPVVITDVRYPNEVEWINRNGGFVIYIRREGYEAANEEERWSVTAARPLTGAAVANSGPVAFGHGQVRAAVEAHYGLDALKGDVMTPPTVREIESRSDD